MSDTGFDHATDHHASAPDAGADYENAGHAKASFDEMYVSPDPRSYCATLAPLDYQIPQHGADVFRTLLPHVAPGRRATVLDLCCSYGFVGVQLRTDLTNADIFAHYAAPEQSRLSPEGMLDLDRRYLAAHRLSDPPVVIGLDSSAPATSYGQAAGLMDRAFAENLEQAKPSAVLADALPGVDLITTTGGVGYITDATYDSIMSQRREVGAPLPWVASLVLRMYPYDSIIDTLDGYGLVTEKVAGPTVVQRSFVDDDEQAQVLQALDELGLSTTGLEADGSYHAEIFVSRPADDAGQPLAELLG